MGDHREIRIKQHTKVSDTVRGYKRIVTNFKGKGLHSSWSALKDSVLGEALVNV